MLNPNNPLVIYQRELTRKNVGTNTNNWQIIADELGLPVNSILAIARADQNKSLSMRLGTYVKIKEKLGVDMLVWISE
jgi:hypothetical protein